MLIMSHYEVCYEILIYKSKLPLFFEFNILEKDINETLCIFDNFC